MDKQAVGGVPVPADVLRAILAVRETGEVNMFDRAGVMHVLDRLGEPVAFMWVYDHPREYGLGILRGFQGQEGVRDG